jgi:hypothetical protein
LQTFDFLETEACAANAEQFGCGYDALDSISVKLTVVATVCQTLINSNRGDFNSRTAAMA